MAIILPYILSWIVVGWKTRIIIIILCCLACQRISSKQLDFWQWQGLLLPPWPSNAIPNTTRALQEGGRIIGHAVPRHVFKRWDLRWHPVVAQRNQALSFCDWPCWHRNTNSREPKTSSYHPPSVDNNILLCLTIATNRASCGRSAFEHSTLPGACPRSNTVCLRTNCPLLPVGV